MVLRWLLLLLYCGGFIALNYTLLKRPPTFNGKFVFPLLRALHVLVGIWGASLWPFLGLVWVGIHPALTVTLMLSLSFFIPLFFFAIYLTWLKVFGSFWTSMLGVAFLGVINSALAILLVRAVSILPALLILALIALAPLLTILLFLAWFPSLIPIEPGSPDHRRNALALFTGLITTFPRPTWVVEGGKVTTRIQGNPSFGTGPGCVTTEPENVVVLKSGSKIGRIVGPGSALTDPNESVHSVIDLRQQLRVSQVQAITQDGIKVDLRVYSVFRINPGGRALRLSRPWPYDPDDARRVVFAAEVNPAGKTPLDAHITRPWQDIPIEVSKNLLRQVIINYNLDALYEPVTGQAIPRLKIGGTVRAPIEAILTPMGFRIDDAWTVRRIVPADDDVIQQRIEAWKARWVRQIMEWQGEAQAQRLERFAAVQRRARVDLLFHLIDEVNTARGAAGGNFDRNLAAYHLLGNLERIASDPEVQFLLPESALPALTSLRQRIGEDEEP